MKKIIFEAIRTVFFATTMCAALIFLGVAMNEIWLIHLKFQPIFPEFISVEKILHAFQFTGAIALVTMPIVLFGMACRAYSQRKTVKDGEEVIKISMAFALMLVVLPTVLLVVQEKWEHLFYFGAYWLAVVIVGKLGKLVPMTPLVVRCLDARF